MASSPVQHARAMLGAYYGHGQRNDAVDVDADARRLVGELAGLIELQDAEAEQGQATPGDLADLAEVLDTAERLAARVQRAVGEEGDVFDFASRERMEQADELSRELLPLAETVLEADAVTILAGHRCEPEGESTGESTVERDSLGGRVPSYGPYLRCPPCDEAYWDGRARWLPDARQVLPDHWYRCQRCGDEWRTIPAASPAEGEAESGDPILRRVQVHVCEPCLAAEGGECHAPGCALWMHDIEEVPRALLAALQDATSAEDEAADAWARMRSFLDVPVSASPTEVAEAAAQEHIERRRLEGENERLRDTTPAALHLDVIANVAAALEEWRPLVDRDVAAARRARLATALREAIAALRGATSAPKIARGRTAETAADRALAERLVPDEKRVELLLTDGSVRFRGTVRGYLDHPSFAVELDDGRIKPWSARLIREAPAPLAIGDTVETAEQLDALPLGTWLLAADGTTRGIREEERGAVWAPGGAGVDWALPITILGLPGATP